MLVHSLWDQEDIYGAIAVYKALEPKDTANDKVFLVMGPWHHGQQIGEGSSLGALQFRSDTALYFRTEVLAPFLAHYLKDDAPAADVAPVTAFETGTNRWERLNAWPADPRAPAATPAVSAEQTAGRAAAPSAVPARPASAEQTPARAASAQGTPLYLRAGALTSFDAPRPGDAPFDEYVSDPAKPVPYRARPSQPIGYEPPLTWPQWLVDDQREASGRPDVVAFASEVLKTPLKIGGQPIANLVASTTGTDADWVVKLIDVYPDEVAGQPGMGGYQLMISADIFRGRYRDSFETPKAIAAGAPLPYRFALPTANHVFLPGHRVMVQVQSSWFPLYDRNPQTFVPNIFWAKPEDYRKAVHRVYHAPDHASFVELPVVSSR
jgi:predicted acyl esterase